MPAARCKAYLPHLITMSTLAFSLDLTASMSITPIITYFRAGTPPRQDITVSNPDPEPLYLETEILRVENPGTEQEKNIPISDPSQIRLLATPQKAIIQPGKSKPVRIISLETPKEEQVYRITFRPVIGKLTVKQSAIKILIAYQALVFVQPANPVWKVEAHLEKDQLKFTNTGNINIIIRNIRFCPEKNSKQCDELDQTHRIYGGKSWSTSLPSRFIQRQGTLFYGIYNGSAEETQALKLPVRPVIKKG